MSEKLPFVVRNYEVVSRKISAPVRFVFLTDFHETEFDAGNRRLLREIHAAAPDAVLIGGDMIVSRRAEEESDAWYAASERLLSELAADYSVFAAPGNHETSLADEKKGLPVCYESYLAMLDRRGIIRLENACADFGGIRIHGLVLDRIYYKKFRWKKLQGSVIASLLGDAGGDAFTLLLAHHPRYFDAYAAWGADLTLSGHLHGGIVRVKDRGIVSPDPAFFPRYSGGEYRIGEHAMIVSCGLGVHTIPLRIWNPPELSVIDILPA